MVERMGKRLLAFVLAVVFATALVPTMPAMAATINIGDYIQMGTYYGEPILWRCVAFEKISGYDENGNPIIDSTDTVTEYQEGYLPLMLTDKIICLKPFDAECSSNWTTGSHDRSSGRAIYDSNYWGDSNMRSWLNSTASAGNVEWLCGNPPVAERLWNGCNAYDQEAGFLSNFTQSERNAMKAVTQKSLLSDPEIDAGMATTGTEHYESDYDIEDVVKNYDTAYAEYITDKMFLLDVKQVNAVYNNGSILGEDYYIGEPTAECVANSEYKNEGYLEAGKKWSYWLRSPDPNSYDDVYYVYSDGYVTDYDASYGELGVRPAFYLNLSSFTATSGEGTESNPYVCGENTVNRVNLSTVGKYSDSIVATAENTDGVLDVELDIIDAEVTAEDVTVYAAQYDCDSLVSVVILAPSISEEKIVYSGNVTSDTYKVFVWDKDFVPVTYSYENN